MKKPILKALSVVLALIFVVSSFVGCGKGSDNSTAEASKTTGTDASNVVEDKYDKLPKEVSAIIFDRAKVPASEGSYEENRWTKWINEQSGVKVTWVPVPRAQATDKMNIMLASGNAPDILFDYSRDYIAQLVESGSIQPISEYVDKYSTVYKDYIEKNSDLKPFLKFNDKTYAMTNKRGLQITANYGMWIRKDWLDNLKLKAPTTDEELLTVAKAFKEKDPDGNSKDDTYGIAFNTAYGSSAAGSFGFNGLVDGLYGVQWPIILENGKTSFRINTDQFKAALAFKKRVFDEGLIDKEYLTDKNFAKERQLLVTGNAGIYLSSWNIEAEWNDLKKNVPTAELVPLETVSTKYGKFGVYQEPPANRYVVFNKDMKNPKAAIQFLDWCLDKGWYSLTYGIEGTHYKKVNDIPQVIDQEKYKNEVDYSWWEYPLLTQQSETADWFPIRSAADANSQEYAKLKGESLKLTTKYKFPRTTPFNFTSAEAVKLDTDIKTFADDVVAKVITGGNQYTPDWAKEQIINERKRLGGDVVDKQIQDWYTQNKTDFEAFANAGK